MNVPEDKPSRGEQEDGNVLTRNHRQEGICKSYITAAASRCGMGWSVPHPDYGIDLTLNDIESYDDSLAESGYKLDVQGKSATRTQLTVTHVKYDLERRAYDLLRQPIVGTPRILVVLVLPREESLWTAQTEHELTLRHCAYWMSLRGRPPSANRRFVRVEVPRTNIFSVKALQDLMRRIKRGEPL
jgi:Domain of unknown function (DUF4365)